MKQAISLASKNDLSKIMSFIDTHWKSGHLLSKDKNFFLYEYENKENLDFVIAKDQKLNVVATLGFLRSSSKRDSDIWTTMWKVSERLNNPILGVQLLDYLKKLEFRTLMSSGINKETIPIYQYLDFCPVRHIRYVTKIEIELIGSN